MSDVYDNIRHIWCSLCDEPHEPCEDEFACLDRTPEEWARLDAFYDREHASTDPDVSP